MSYTFYSIHLTTELNNNYARNVNQNIISWLRIQNELCVYIQLYGCANGSGDPIMFYNFSESDWCFVFNQ